MVPLTSPNEAQRFLVISMREPLENSSWFASPVSSTEPSLAPFSNIHGLEFSTQASTFAPGEVDRTLPFVFL